MRRNGAVRWTYITVAALMLTLIVMLILAYWLPVIVALEQHKR